MASRFAQADLSGVRRVSIDERGGTVRVEDLVRPYDPGDEMDAFLGVVPGLFMGGDFRSAVDAIAGAARDGRTVLVMFGAHLVKCGLSRLLIDLMERKIVTALATNGAGTDRRGKAHGEALPRAARGRSPRSAHPREGAQSREARRLLDPATRHRKGQWVAHYRAPVRPRRPHSAGARGDARARALLQREVRGLLEAGYGPGVRARVTAPRRDHQARQN